MQRLRIPGVVFYYKNRYYAFPPCTLRQLDERVIVEEPYSHPQLCERNVASQIVPCHQEPTLHAAYCSMHSIDPTRSFHQLKHFLENIVEKLPDGYCPGYIYEDGHLQRCPYPGLQRINLD